MYDKPNFFLGIYWEAREDSISTCCDMLYKTFNFFKGLDESFNYWYNTQKPKKGQLIIPIEVDIKSIEKILLEGQNRNSDGTVNHDLGYIIYLKSCENFSKAHVLSIICGVYNQLISNSLTINFSTNEKLNPLLIEEVKFIFFELTKIWKPEKGLIRLNDVEILSKV